MKDKQRIKFLDLYNPERDFEKHFLSIDWDKERQTIKADYDKWYKVIKKVIDKQTKIKG